jgi:hypothetical protein
MPRSIAKLAFSLSLAGKMIFPNMIWGTFAVRIMNAILKHWIQL